MGMRQDYFVVNDVEKLKKPVTVNYRFWTFDLRNRANAYFPACLG